MAGNLVRRIALSAITLWIVSVAVYAAIRLAPGAPGPGEDALGPRGGWRAVVSAEEPIGAGYARWIAGAIRLDLGTSIGVAPGRPVADLVAGALPCTLLLGTLGFILTWLLAIPLGLVSAWRPVAPASRLAGGLLFLLHALPAFWIALALQQVAAGRLGLLPPIGSGPIEGAPGLAGMLASIPYWILPTAAVAAGSLAFVIRFCRTAILEAASRPCVAAARARGAGPARVLCRHALAGAYVPLVSLTGLMLPGIVSGSVVIETIYGLPGVGRLLFLAAGRRDYPVIMALALLTAAATVAAHLAADLLLRCADPRLGTDQVSQEVTG